MFLGGRNLSCFKMRVLFEVVMALFVVIVIPRLAIKLFSTQLVEVGISFHN